MWGCRIRRSRDGQRRHCQERQQRSNPVLLCGRVDCFASLAMTGIQMLTLYFAPGSSSFAVHIALHEIGVPFEGKPMSFHQNDMRKAEFLKVNPEGKVPTLLVDGRPLTEVDAILFYLARRYPDAGLLPDDI